MTQSELSVDRQPVDLADFACEPTPLLAAIQPFGVLFAFSPDWTLVHVSANVSDVIGRGPGDLLGLPASQFIRGDALHAIRSRVQWLTVAGSAERLFGIDLFGHGRPYDVALHLSGGRFVVEVEPCGGAGRIDAVPVLRNTMASPGHFVRALAAAPAAAAPAPRQRLVPADAIVLLVEDNLVIAMDAEAMLEEMGFADVKVATSAGAAMRLVEAGGIDCALLDVNLGRETSLPVAEALLARGIPFVFASGYGDPELLPEALRTVAIVTKPYGETRVVEALCAAIAAARPA